MMRSIHQPYTVRVYIEDTDCYGIVYHAKYLSFMERARTERLAQAGLTLDQLAKADYLFVIREAKLQYKKALKVNTLIDVTCDIKQAGRSSLIFIQTITQHATTDIIYCTGEIQIVCTNRKMKPRTIPEFVLQGFQASECNMEEQSVVT